MVHCFRDIELFKATHHHLFYRKNFIVYGVQVAMACWMDIITWCLFDHV